MIRVKDFFSYTSSIYQAIFNPHKIQNQQNLKELQELLVKLSPHHEENQHPTTWYGRVKDIDKVLANRKYHKYLGKILIHTLRIYREHYLRCITLHDEAVISSFFYTE